MFPKIYGNSLRDLNLGSHYLELVADTGNTHYYRAVMAKIHGKPVGYLRDQLASYFQPQIIRMNKAGISPFVHCRIISQNMVLHRFTDHESLVDQTHDLIAVKGLLDGISAN